MMVGFDPDYKVPGTLSYFPRLKYVRQSDAIEMANASTDRMTVIRVRKALSRKRSLLITYSRSNPTEIVFTASL